MTDVPDKALFSVNERPRDYTVTVKVCGRITIDIEADSNADAEAKAGAEIDKIWDDGYVEITDLEEVDVSYVSKDPPMFRVLRDGKAMQVSRLTPGDAPRDPDERGF